MSWQTHQTDTYILKQLFEPVITRISARWHLHRERMGRISLRVILAKCGLKKEIKTEPHVGFVFFSYVIKQDSPHRWCWGSSWSWPLCRDSVSAWTRASGMFHSQVSASEQRAKSSIIQQLFMFSGPAALAQETSKTSWIHPSSHSNSVWVCVCEDTHLNALLVIDPANHLHTHLGDLAECRLLQADVSQDLDDSLPHADACVLGREWADVSWCHHLPLEHRWPSLTYKNTLRNGPHSKCEVLMKITS